MAYNYNPNYFNQQNFPQIQQPFSSTQSGFVSVRSEAEARNYPVAYGNSVTFKDETSPYVYTKTMGFSQLDRPVFEKYKLVKEDVKEEPKKDCKCERTKTEIDDLQTQIDSLWKEVNFLKEKRNRRNDNESNGNCKSI